jgi:hypothetical protein
MKNKKVKYKRGNLKKIVDSLIKNRFTGSIRFERGEILFSEGNLVFIIYDNKLGKESLESIDKTFDYKIEELNNEELQLRIKWHEVIGEIKDDKSREEIMKDLGIQSVERKYMIKILEKEDLSHLLKESDDNASSEE